MSRRRGEFEHRTSIFEGSYRAWSHLGGCPADKLQSPTASEDLDPVVNPHDPSTDERLNNEESKKMPTPAPTISSTGKELRYVYEPLPRSGLQHPFVQAILAPWLGPTADEDDMQAGLTTLRTWWQHRRKGESASAVKALGSVKMKSVVEGYTKHFFDLAMCIVIEQKESPPRSLQGKIASKPENDDGEEKSGMDTASSKKKVKSELGVEDMEDVSEGNCCGGNNVAENTRKQKYEDNLMETPDHVASSSPSYGNPNRTPVVFVSANGDIQIALSVKGITCNSCIKMIETVLRGVSGSESSVSGLIDAVADRDLHAVLIKIEKASYAKRVAHESVRMLSMLGYEAVAREMDIVDANGVKLDLKALSTAYDVVATIDEPDVFDWTLDCNCPDDGVIRHDCVRHSQMNKRVFDAFDRREKQVMSHVAGCAKKYGMPCTCKPGTCTCKSNCCAKLTEQPQQHLSSSNQLYDESSIGQPIPFYQHGITPNRVGSLYDHYQSQPQQQYQQQQFQQRQQAQLQSHLPQTSFLGANNPSSTMTGLTNPTNMLSHHNTYTNIRQHTSPQNIQQQHPSGYYYVPSANGHPSTQNEITAEAIMHLQQQQQQQQQFQSSYFNSKFDDQYNNYNQTYE